MMVLDAKQRETLLQRPLCGHVTGMEVVHQKLGCGLKKVLQMGDNLLKMAVCFKVFHVADMLAHQRMGTLQERNRVFQFTSGTKYDGSPFTQINRCRHISPAPPDLTQRSCKVDGD